MCGGHIFGFSGGQGNKFLFSGTLGDSFSVDEESIAKDGMPMFLHCTIRICVAD